MTNKTSSGTTKHHEGTKPRTCEMGQMFFFLLLSSDRLAQCCVYLSWWFTHETAAFCTEQCTTLSLFHNFEVCRGTLTDHLATKWNYYSKLLN